MKYNANEVVVTVDGVPIEPLDVLEDYEETYESFWKDIVENPDGSLNLDQVKRELHDCALLLDAVSKVYCHVTGGIVSKPLTDPSVVCSLADEHYEESYGWIRE